MADLTAPPDVISWPLVLGTGALALGVVGLFYLSIQGAGHAASYRRPNPMRVQSLLFPRKSWTLAKAKAWAAKHGYRSAKTDVTDRYIRLRQKSPAGYRTLRTVTFGKGIRAIVAR